MNLARLEHDINTLPSEAQKEVADFVAFLKQKYVNKRVRMVKQDTASRTAGQLLNSGVVGLWKGRKLTASTEYARELREMAQQRSRL